MSHTTTIDAVAITDVDALKAAIKELKDNGIRCDLLENKKPRAYSANQEGMAHPADFVLHLHDSPYDVGLYKNEDNAYEARTDLWNNHVAKILGVPAGPGESKEQAALGKLFQTYAIHAATRKAVQQGYNVTRVTKEDGSVQLRVAV